MYSVKKATEVAVYLLIKAGGKMPYLKLMKLMYLADREYLLQHKSLLTGDSYASLPHGPVLSQTLNVIRFGTSAEWSKYIADLGNYQVGLKDESISLDKLDWLNFAAQKVIDLVWDQYGHLDEWTVRDITHTEVCPEWQDPHGSSHPIKYSDVLLSHGIPKHDVEDILMSISEQDAYLKFIADMT